MIFLPNLFRSPIGMNPPSNVELSFVHLQIDGESGPFTSWKLK